MKKRALILSLLLLSAATAVAADVRSLFLALDDDAVVREVQNNSSATVAERALAVAALVRLYARDRAMSEAAKLREQHPNDAWSWYAVAAADVYEEHEASEKMLALAGSAPDELMISLRSRILCGAGRCDDALNSSRGSPSRRIFWSREVLRWANCASRGIPTRGCMRRSTRR